jgi:hypothetical protein
MSKAYGISPFDRVRTFHGDTGSFAQSFHSRRSRCRRSKEKK